MAAGMKRDAFIIAGGSDNGGRSLPPDAYWFVTICALIISYNDPIVSSERECLRFKLAVSVGCWKNR